MTTVTNNTIVDEPSLDRWAELNRFDETKLGVKGLVDSGVTRVPRIFQRPTEPISEPHEPAPGIEIPVIDLSAPTPGLVGRVREASARFGFFQVVNHGVPLSVLDRLLGSTRAFHELPAHEKKNYYGRALASDVVFFSNVDLFQSKVASWRDTLQIRLGPGPVAPAGLPPICRDEVVKWEREIKQLAERVAGLLSEGLGVAADKLKGMSCLGLTLMVAHYYPPCPEPDKTVGIAPHSDPVVLTLLLQDHVGGLQVKREGRWVDVKPHPGALVVNVGDLLQIISNDQYTSVEHRVLANARDEPRMSIAVFFNPSRTEDLYGPLSELVSPEKPALYRKFTYTEFITRYFNNKGLDRFSLPGHFRLQNEM